MVKSEDIDAFYNSMVTLSLNSAVPNAAAASGSGVSSDGMKSPFGASLPPNANELMQKIDATLQDMDALQPEQMERLFGADADQPEELQQFKHTLRMAICTMYTLQHLKFKSIQNINRLKNARSARAAALKGGAGLAQRPTPAILKNRNSDYDGAEGASNGQTTLSAAASKHLQQQQLKASKMSCILPALSVSQSNVAKLVMLMYALPSGGAIDNLRKKVLLSVLHGTFQNYSMHDIVALSTKSAAELAEALNAATSEHKQQLEDERAHLSADQRCCAEEMAVRKQKIEIVAFVSALIELAEFLRSNNFSKLALDINYKCYMNMLSKYLSAATNPMAGALALGGGRDHCRLRTYHPFDALIQHYLNVYVPQCSKMIERKKILNQVTTNIESTMHHLIETIHREELKQKQQLQLQHSSTISVATSGGSTGGGVLAKNRLFKSDQTYYVYFGRLHFMKHLVISYYPYKERVYQIVTLMDCLYDVLGCERQIIDPSNNKTIGIDTELFSRKTWPERLDMLPYRAKVAIETLSGQQLNEYNGSSGTITCAWMNDDGQSVQQSYTFYNKVSITSSSSSGASAAALSPRAQSDSRPNLKLEHDADEATDDASESMEY